MKTIKTKKGFTLLELIIVLTLASVFLIGIITTYLQIQKVLKSQTQASFNGQKAEELYEILSHDLQNIVVEPWNRKYFFTAQKSILGGARMDFLNFISGSLYSNPLALQTQVYNVTYFAEADPQSGELTLYRSEDMFTDYKNTKGGIPVPVLENIREFRAEFSIDNKNWVDDWDYSLKQRIPIYIRITIRFISNKDSLNPEKTLVLQTSPGLIM